MTLHLLNLSKILYSANKIYNPFFDLHHNFTNKGSFNLIYSKICFANNKCTYYVYGGLKYEYLFVF